MKLYQSIALMGLAVFGLASCSEEPDFKAYDPAAETTEEQVTFAQAELKYSFVPTDEIPSQFPVVVRRANAADSVKVKLNATSSDATIINCVADSVEFEVGSLVDTLWVDFDADNYVIGEEYTLDLELAVDSGVSAVSAAGLGETSVTIFVDYTWVSAGSCQFTSLKPFEEGPVTVQIIHAAESDGLYRLVSPYAKMTTEGLEYESGYNISFYLDEDYNITGLANGEDMGVYDEGEMMWIYYNPSHPSYGSICTCTNTGNVFECGFLVAEGSSLVDFGAFTFTWDNGYPGDE